jgi:hypothetical protein
MRRLAPLLVGALLAVPSLVAQQRPTRAPAPLPPATPAPARAPIADSAKIMRRGIVTDTAGKAVEGANVKDLRTGTTQFTDSIGRFTVRGVRVGAVSLEISAPGYESMTFDFAAEPGDTTTLVVPLVRVLEPPVLPFARLPQSLAGRVLDPNGRPLDDATVQVVTAMKEVRTDTLGRFALAPLPTGRHLVRARRVGYLAESFFTTITDSTSARLTIQLTPLGQDLGTVNVRARAGTRRMQDFELRRQRNAGFGSFMTGDEIRARNPIYLTDAFRTMRGVTVTTNASGRQILVGRGQCLMSVRVDGMEMPLGDAGLDAFVMPQDVAGIEVYPGDAAVPMELRSMRGGCGVVAIWTR